MDTLKILKVIGNKGKDEIPIRQTENEKPIRQNRK